MESKIYTYKLMFKLLIFLSCVVGYFSYFLGQRYSYIYYYGFLSLPIFLLLSAYFNKKAKYFVFLKEVHEGWGVVRKSKRNFNEISSLFKLTSMDGEFYIDDQTYEDLNLSDVFSVIDRTYTKAGQNVLYNFLRKPLFSKDDLLQRLNNIKFFEANNKLREKIMICFFPIKDHKKNYALNILYGDLPKDSFVKYIIYFLSLLAFISPLMIILSGIQGGLTFMAIIFCINIFVHVKIKKSINENITSIGQLGSIVGVAKKLCEIDIPEFNKYKVILNPSVKKCSNIMRKTRMLGRIDGIDVFGDYINIFYLLEITSYFKVINDLNKYREDLKLIYNTIGEIDALISISSYRAGVKDFCEPSFVESSFTLDIEDMRHPLIDKEKAVPNSISLSKGGIIITGSNMSGKSTYLRSLGITALFSQTLCTCLCKEYKGSLLKVLTSISPQDNILGGKSYYLGEAEALLRIVKESSEGIPCLCIIDEIFRGTNPIERVAAAAEILDYIVEHNGTAVVATHDIELTHLTKNKYECYYFSEDVEENGLKFDYKLKKGISNTRNAIKLLKFLGYPDSIITMANSRIGDV